ncbi:hypothetical protein EXIGLDRAFT_842854 [Exidia glandulosa HHB12029]|uniref:Uncharacterized protein n=1 Tax=Exidia glandulosa HHB12029 TaxID=1314781 RepID=A0A165D0F8_EXIGL|nr:hypothetical protein EXIGLDRAFT_842854 [Exidia glandulosa HHB12029]
MAPVDDDVVPVPLLQQITTALDIMYTMDVIVRGELRPELLKASLEHLTRLGDWRKLGSRLKTSKQHGYELYIPQAFSTERPAFQWDERRVAGSAAKAGLLLERTRDVSYHPALRDMLDPYRSKKFPLTLKELLTSPKRADESILSVSVVAFEDATLVSITLPHIFTDAMGMSHIFSAWCTVLAGRPDDVPAFVGFKEDPLKDVEGKFPSDIPRAHRVRHENGLKVARLYSKYAVEIIRFKEDTRIIFIPVRKLDAIKAAADAELKSQGAEGWVSTADAVSAIFMKLACLHDSPKDTRLFSLGFAANARNRTPALTGPSSAGCVGCSVLQLNTVPTPSNEIQRASLAQLAIMHRSAVKQLDSHSEVAANISTLREAYQLKRMPLYCKIRGSGYFVTNWSAGAFNALDFSPALVDGASDGKVVFVGGSSGPPGSERRNWCIVFSKDGNGIPEEDRGVWAETAFSVHKWPKVEEYLASL